MAVHHEIDANPAADTDAGFAAALDLHRGRLVRLCRRMGWPPAEADDIAQETLVRAFAHRERCDVSTPLWPWLRTIANNLARDTAARRRREVLVDPAERPSTATGLAGVEQRDMISRALAGLSPRHRLALALLYLEDRDAEEVRARLGVSAVAFRQLIVRARGRLRQELRRFGPDGVAAGWASVRRVGQAIWRGLARPGAGGGRLEPFLARLAPAVLAAALLVVPGELDPFPRDVGAAPSRPAESSIRAAHPGTHAPLQSDSPDAGAPRRFEAAAPVAQQDAPAPASKGAVGRLVDGKDDSIRTGPPPACNVCPVGGREDDPEVAARPPSPALPRPVDDAAGEGPLVAATLPIRPPR